LALVSVITITLYWQLYTLGADSTKLLPQTGMTFSFFVTMVGSRPASPASAQCSPACSIGGDARTSS
jgi:hypothetical protein